MTNDTLDRARARHEALEALLEIANHPSRKELPFGRELRAIHAALIPREPSEAEVKKVADAMQDDPFADDIPLSGTTQQRLRCEHYARAAIAAMSTNPQPEKPQ